MADREFIAAKDLPVTEAEEVNVLVVDPATGELAQKAGANLGGEKADLVISLIAPIAFGGATSENISVAIKSGSLDAVVDAMRDGRPPVVKCERFFVEQGFDTEAPMAEGGVCDCDVAYYNGTISMAFAIPHQLMAKIMMNIDAPDYLEFWIYPLVMSAVQVI